jgi:hypothetical protein
MQDSQGSSQTAEDLVSLLNPRGFQERAHSEIPLCENCGAVLIPHHAGIIKQETMSPICIVCGHQNKVTSNRER